MPISYDMYTVHTRDGFALTLYRSHPLGPRSLATPPALPPVLLVPGFGSNRFTFGVQRHHSLARALNADGRDVWLAELRGTRSARWLGRGRARIDIDAKLRTDLPAVLDFIEQTTRSPKIDLIGHSLGGLLALMAAGGTESHRVGRVATLATPGTFKGIAGGLEATGPLFRGLARGVERMFEGMDLKVAPLARTRGPLPHLFAFSRHFLPGACDADVRRLYLDHAVEDVAGGELAQLTRWVRDGELTDQDGHSLEPLLAAVRVPVKVIATTRDKIVSESAAYATYAKVGSTDKRFYLVGRAHGAQRDYAHADLILAPTAKQDLMQPLADWLNQPRHPATRRHTRPVAAPVPEAREA